MCLFTLFSVLGNAVYSSSLYPYAREQGERQGQGEGRGEERRDGEEKKNKDPYTW